MESIVFINEINKNDTLIAGGKGASLGEMTQADILIPPGFIITAQAFTQFLVEEDINIEIDSILHSVDINQIHTIDQASEQIQQLILNAEFPKKVKEEVQKAFDTLGAPFVAVRSSATAEDGAKTAWAGQLETYLNTTQQDIFKNIKKCWASLFIPRAIFYRFENNLHTQEIAVAVVIQEMVQSEISGIAFSVHPITQDCNQLIIEAAYGLGESIVSGQITPDSYVVEKEPKRILDKNIFKQEKGLFKDNNNKTDWQRIDEIKASNQVLTDNQILELSQLILKIEKHYAFPCDIEWAFYNNKFYITQSRPITTLSNKNQKEEPLDSINYQRLFQGHNFPYLSSSLFMDYYKNLGGVITNSNNKWTSYIPLSVKEETLEEGLMLYSDFDKFSKYKKEFKEYIAHSERFFNTTLKKSGLTTKDVKEYLEQIKQQFYFYSKMEFFYTDTAYLNMSNNSNIQECFKEFEQFKIDGRKYLNKIMFVGNSFINRLVEKLARQFSLNKDDLLYYDPNELLFLFNGKIITDDILNTRRVAYFTKGENKNRVDFFGIEAIEKINLFEPNPKNTEVLKGQIACSGYIKATAKVAQFDLAEFDNVHKIIASMEQGQVLVTETTSPEIMAACNKASGIVTNQGGLMSHAAIISRELNIPCIVGVGNATELIKDGDEIIVNANKGTVSLVIK